MTTEIFSSDIKIVAGCNLFLEYWVTINRNVVEFIYLIHYRSDYMFRSKVIKHIYDDVESVALFCIAEMDNNLKNDDNWEMENHHCDYRNIRGLAHKHLILLKLLMEALI